MEIIDAQIHLPHPVRHLDANKFGQEVDDVISVELAREAMDSVGVDVAVLTASMADHQKAYGRYPDRFAGCIVVDFKQTDMDSYIRTLKKAPGVVAARMGLHSWQTGKLNELFLSGKHDPVVAACAKHNMPMAIYPGGHAKEIEPWLAKYPELTVSLVHVGMPALPPMAPVAPDPWASLQDVLNLAKYPKVSVKLTGICALSQQHYPFDDIKAPFEKLLNAYGPQRLLWGTDFTRQRMAPGTIEQGPRSGWPSNYGHDVHWLLNYSGLSASDKEWIFGKAIRRQWNWAK